MDPSTTPVTFDPKVSDVQVVRRMRPLHTDSPLSFNRRDHTALTVWLLTDDPSPPSDYRATIRLDTITDDTNAELLSWHDREYTRILQGEVVLPCHRDPISDGRGSTTVLAGPLFNIDVNPPQPPARAISLIKGSATLTRAKDVRYVIENFPTLDGTTFEGGDLGSLRVTLEMTNQGRGFKLVLRGDLPSFRSCVTEADGRRLSDPIVFVDNVDPWSDLGDIQRAYLLDALPATARLTLHPSQPDGPPVEVPFAIRDVPLPMAEWVYTSVTATLSVHRLLPPDPSADPATLEALAREYQELRDKTLREILDGQPDVTVKSYGPDDPSHQGALRSQWVTFRHVALPHLGAIGRALVENGVGVWDAAALEWLVRGVKGGNRDKNYSWVTISTGRTTIRTNDPADPDDIDVELRIAHHLHLRYQEDSKG